MYNTLIRVYTKNTYTYTYWRAKQMIILFSDHPSSPEYDETSWNLYSNGWQDPYAAGGVGGLAGSRDIWSARGVRNIDTTKTKIGALAIVKCLGEAVLRFKQSWGQTTKILTDKADCTDCQ